MAIYKDIGFGTVMGLSEDDLKKKDLKKEICIKKELVKE